MPSSDRSEWKARIERALSELKTDASDVVRDARSNGRDAQKSPNESCTSR